MTESNDLAAIAEPVPERMSWRDRLSRAMGGDAWTIGLTVVFVALFAATLLLRPNYGLEALAIASLPVAFAAAGQAIVVISGGIDLSIGSVIALTNVISAVLFLNAPELSVPVVAAGPADRHRHRGRSTASSWSSAASPTSSSRSRCCSSGPAPHCSSCRRPAAIRSTGSVT